MRSGFWKRLWQETEKPENRHFRLLLFWPVYLLAFFAMERLRPASTVYASMHCRVDDWIPFCEYFILFYLFWFFFMAAMLTYAGFFEPGTFRRLMGYFMLTFSVAAVLFLVFPSRQDLRPPDFAPKWWDPFGLLTQMIFQLDTPTNVCPSEHVIGAFGVVFAARDTKRFSSGKWTVLLTAQAVLIALSTLFVKQHSAVDVAAAVPVCLLGWAVCFYGSQKFRPAGRLLSRESEEPGK